MLHSNAEKCIKQEKRIIIKFNIHMCNYKKSSNKKNNN
jgi:hypothetical protein